MLANGDAVKILAKSTAEYGQLLTVISGVGEIVKKQAAGWAYIRPWKA